MLNVAALAVQCGVLVDHGLMEAIVHVESRGNPHALSVNGDVELVREPRSREEAVAMARWLQTHGYNFDAGLGQVNSANLARLGLDVVTVFDPCANVRAASRVLAECHERAVARVGRGERAITAALSCYNTGHFTRGVRNGYVDAVRAGVSPPLAVVARNTMGRAFTTDAASAVRSTSEKERSDGATRMAAGRWAAAASRGGDVFAHRVADAFGDTRTVQPTRAGAQGSGRERTP